MTDLTYNHHQKPISGVKNLLNRAGHSVSAFLANISVALAWENGRRAHPADLERAGFTRDFENRIIANVTSKNAD